MSKEIENFQKIREIFDKKLKTKYKDYLDDQE